MKHTKASRSVEMTVLPSTAVKATGNAVRVGGPRRHGLCAEPKIELIRDGDTITAIDVTCTCGQRIRINCSY